MKEIFFPILAFSPIFLAGILLIVFKIAARIAMPLVFIFTSIISYFVWGMSEHLVTLLGYNIPNLGGN